MNSGKLCRGIGWAVMGFNLIAGVGGILVGRYGSVINLAWVPLLYVMIKINKEAHDNYERNVK